MYIKKTDTCKNVDLTKWGLIIACVKKMESDSVQNHIDKRFAHSAANELKKEFVKVNVLKSEIN